MSKALSYVVSSFLDSPDILCSDSKSRYLVQCTIRVTFIGQRKLVSGGLKKTFHCVLIGLSPKTRCCQSLIAGRVPNHIFNGMNLGSTVQITGLVRWLKSLEKLPRLTEVGRIYPQPLLWCNNEFLCEMSLCVVETPTSDSTEVYMPFNSLLSTHINRLVSVVYGLSDLLVLANPMLYEIQNQAYLSSLKINGGMDMQENMLSSSTISINQESALGIISRSGQTNGVVPERLRAPLLVSNTTDFILLLIILLKKSGVVTTTTNSLLPSIGDLPSYPKLPVMTIS